MRKTSLFLGMFLLLSFSGMADSKSRLDSLMNFFVAKDNFNGTVLVARKGTILLSKGYGVRDEESKVPNDEHTIFAIGTSTEQFTSEFLLELDSQGRLALTDNLSKYLPDFPNGNNITLKQMLTHTSGIYNYAKDPKWALHPELPVTAPELMNLLKTKPMDFEPGTKFDYSASNYILLGLVIEKITGQKYEDNLQEHILNTCSMTHSGFGFSALVSAEKATGYTNVANNYQKATLVNTAGSNAAHGLYSTTGDMLRWHKALHDYRLLPKDWQEIAYAPNKNRFALGWYIYRLYNKRFIQHSGTTAGFSTFIMRQEEDDLFIIIMENMPHGELNRSIAYTILKSLYDNSYHTPINR